MKDPTYDHDHRFRVLFYDAVGSWVSAIASMLMLILALKTGCHSLLTVDIMLHGISVLGNDGGTRSVTVKVSLFASPEDCEGDDDNDDVYSDEEIVLASTSGTYISGRRESGQEFHYGYNVSQ